MSHDTQPSIALLLIDVQQGLDTPELGQRSSPDAENNMARLLEAFRARGLPVIHVAHDSIEAGSRLRPELPGNSWKSEVLPHPGEAQFRKNVNSAFVGTGLEDHLRERRIERLVIVGLTTDHCVSASTRSASDLGFDVTLVADATAAFERSGYDGVFYSAEQIHRVNLVSLDGEFCQVRNTADVIDALA